MINACIVELKSDLQVGLIIQVVFFGDIRYGRYSKNIEQELQNSNTIMLYCQRKAVRLK